MTVWCVFDNDDCKHLLFISPTRENAILNCQERGLADENGKLDRWTVIEEWEV